MTAPTGPGSAHPAQARPNTPRPGAAAYNSAMHAAVDPRPAPALPFPAVQALAASDMAAVDALIRRRLASDVALVNQVAEYIIGAGGKRLRPMLTVLAARAAGYRGDAHHQLAAVVEFIHTATLLHDDVVDESDLRRGGPRPMPPSAMPPACSWATSSIRAPSS